MNPPVPAGPTAEDVLGVVHQVVAEFLGLDPDGIPGDSDLRALGADSIDRVEIITALRDRLGVGAPLASFSRIPDLRALAEFLRENRGGER